MLPYARYRQFRRCPDKVRLGAARGDPGEVRREAHWSLIQPVDCGTFHPARTERLFRGPARCLVSLCLSPAKRLASTRTTQLVCCRARLRLSSAREAHVAQAAANAPSRCSHPRGQSIPAPASLPTVPERPLPATPAVGPHSSESTVHTLQRLRLTPAQTVPVCLWCPTSRASARLSSGPSHTSANRSTGWTLLQFNSHCHFSSPNSLAVFYWKTSSCQPYTIVFLIDYSNLPGPAEGRQLNRPTT